MIIHADTVLLILAFFRGHEQRNQDFGLKQPHKIILELCNEIPNLQLINWKCNENGMISYYDTVHASLVQGYLSIT